MRAARTAGPLWPRRLDLRRIVVHDFPLKAAALLIALVFWVANAQNAAPRELVVNFDGAVPVDRPVVPTGFVLRGQLGEVAVTLRGPEGVVDKMGLEDLHATVDLAGVEAGRVEPTEAKILVSVANEAVKVVEWRPATVPVRLERITSRMVAVQTRFANEPPKGTVAGQTSISPSEVRVVGPESSVTSVTAVFATVRFGDVANDITQTAPAVPVDASGVAVEGLQVEPGVVVLSVPLLPAATTRTVPVLWSLRGTVASGYWISQVTTDPVVVTVSGDQQVISSLERIETAAVDVGGLSAPRTFRARLVLPDGVSLLNATDANVTVTVVPLAGSRPFLVAVRVENLATGTTGQTEPGSVTVIISGPAPALAGVSAEQIVATVDAAGRAAGTYPVDVAVRVPQGVTVQTLQPGRVTLTIKGQ